MAAGNQLAAALVLLPLLPLLPPLLLLPHLPLLRPPLRLLHPRNKFLEKLYQNPYQAMRVFFGH